MEVWNYNQVSVMREKGLSQNRQGIAPVVLPELLYPATQLNLQREKTGILPRPDISLILYTIAE